MSVYKLVCFNIDEAIDKVLKRKQSWLKRIMRRIEWWWRGK